MLWTLDRVVKQAIEETWAVFSSGSETPGPALFIAHLGDLARSNAFLWTEAGLQVQERYTRMATVGQGVSRTLVLAAVAADNFVGYSTLRERAQWLPSPVHREIGRCSTSAARPVYWKRLSRSVGH